MHRAQHRDPHDRRRALKNHGNAVDIESRNDGGDQGPDRFEVQVVHLERSQRREAKSHDVRPAEMILPILASVRSIDVREGKHRREPGEELSQDRDAQEYPACAALIGAGDQNRSENP